MSRKGRKKIQKPSSKENKEGTGATSLVDQILSKQYWKKKRKERRKKRLEKKKLEEMKRREFEIQKRIQDQQMSEENMDSNNSQSQSEEGNNVTGEGNNVDVDSLRKQVEEVIGGTSSEEDVVEDKFWDVRDGIFNEGDIVDIEKRTNELLDDNKIPNDDFDTEFSEENYEYIIDRRIFMRIENDLNEIFGHRPEPEEAEEEEIDNTLSLNESFGDLNESGEIINNNSNISNPEKEEKTQQTEGKQEHKSVVDMILSPGYFKNKKRRKKRTGRRRRRKVKK